MWDDLFWYGCIVVDKLKSELFGEGDFYVPFFLSLWNTFSCMFCILQISMLMKIQVGLSLCSALLLFILHVNNYMNLILTIMLWFKNCHGYKMRLTIKTSFVRCTPTNLSKSPRSDHFFNILTEYKLSGENFRKRARLTHIIKKVNALNLLINLKSVWLLLKCVYLIFMLESMSYIIPKKIEEEKKCWHAYPPWKMGVGEHHSNKNILMMAWRVQEVYLRTNLVILIIYWF